jgi:hypothetical protein
MIVYDKTYNGTRYTIEANKIITHPDGTTESARDWARTNHQALTEADDFSVEWADWTNPDDGVYWEGVGDYYYPTLGAAMEAVEQHRKETA